MEGSNQMYGQGTWREEHTTEVVSAQRQKSINLLAYHRGAVLVRLHRTGFPTALIPLLEPTKTHASDPQTTTQQQQRRVISPSLADYSLF